MHSFAVCFDDFKATVSLYCNVPYQSLHPGYWHPICHLFYISNQFSKGVWIKTSDCCIGLLYLLCSPDIVNLIIIFLFLRYFSDSNFCGPNLLLDLILYPYFVELIFYIKNLVQLKFKVWHFLLSLFTNVIVLNFCILDFIICLNWAWQKSKIKKSNQKVKK